MSHVFRYLACALLLGAATAPSMVAAAEVDSSSPQDSKWSPAPVPSESPRFLHDEHQSTQGSVMIGGHAIGYQAEAGVLVVHVKDPMDDDPPLPREDRSGPPPPQPAEASMSYVAYFKGDKEDAHRPITFFYNGGPGSSTVWLHMGAFGPKRVVTPDDKHVPAAPYRVIDNEYSLARCERHGVRRCARNRLRPPARSRQGKGVLRRRSGRARVCELHRGISVAARALEFAEIFVRRKLRNHPLGGAWRTCCRGKNRSI